MKTKKAKKRQHPRPAAPARLDAEASKRLYQGLTNVGQVKELADGVCRTIQNIMKATNSKPNPIITLLAAGTVCIVAHSLHGLHWTAAAPLACAFCWWCVRR